MKKIGCLGLAFIVCISLVGCSIPTEKKQTEKVIEKKKETKQKEEIVKSKPLDFDYATKYADVNNVTYPHFYFMYNEDFSVTNHDCDMDEEQIVFSNDRGTTITYTNYSLPESFVPTGSQASMSKIEVTKVDDANFVPGYVQATSYADLGSFVVAKCQEIGTMNMQTDSDFTDIENGHVFYALLPQSALGIHETNYTGDMEFSFFYGGFVSVLAQSKDNTYTKQEEQDIIDILKAICVEQ